MRHLRRVATLVVVSCGVLLLAGCEYVRLLRPSVLRQLNPRVVKLVNELPEVDQPNEKLVARLFAHGGLGRAHAGRDGVFRARINIPSGQYIWEPAIITMEHAGELELDVSNHDPFSYHAITMQSNGARQLMILPAHKRGKVRVQLDGPGLYWFGCPVANHAPRGMLGLVIVSGEVAPTAKLDRPKQNRPDRHHPRKPERSE